MSGERLDGWAGRSLPGGLSIRVGFAVPQIGPPAVYATATPAQELKPPSLETIPRYDVDEVTPATALAQTGCL